jgi:uncharacterized Zn-binding protein involved in type VI secretion
MADKPATLYFKSLKSGKSYKIIKKIRDDFQGSLIVKENGQEKEIWKGLIDVGEIVSDNKPPVVSAGEDINIKEGTKAVKIDGSAVDLDGEIVSVQWLQNSGPMVQVTEDEEDPTNLTFDAPMLEAHESSRLIEFFLRAIDNQHATAEDRCRVTITKDGQGPPPPPADSQILYDSNLHGKWNDGHPRKVDKTDGDQSKNGKGLYTAASGHPIVTIDGKGVATLECDEGHGRFYTKVCNFNSVFQTDFSILDKTVDNYSQKLRSRHQMGGDCENRPGLFGNATSLIDGDMKTEVCHNVHENSIGYTLPEKLSIGEWYKSRFTVKNSPDDKKVYFIAELDFMDGKGFRIIKEGQHKSPKPAYMDKPKFLQDSEVWNRLNGKGRISFRNQLLTALP